MSLDMALWLATLGMEIAVITLLFLRRVSRLLPIFTVYLIWAVLSDVVMMLIRQRYPAAFTQAFVIEMCVDSVLQFAVLVEVAWSVLSPLRPSLPRGALFAIAGFILLAGLAAWPIAGFSQHLTLPAPWPLMIRLQQTFAILRIFYFLILAAFSQLLSIGWRNRELQVATGLGFYSLASLAVSLMHSYHETIVHFHFVEQILMASYFLSLLYWAFSFMQKEVLRQEFDPRMQSFLLTVSGAARAGRIALKDSSMQSSIRKDIHR